VSARDVPPGLAPADDADDPRHPERALAPDHALGLLDPAERAAYEAHLVGCAECRAELRAYTETTALLADALPPAAPPPHLRARILAEAVAARSAPPSPAVPSPAVPSPAVPSPAPPSPAVPSPLLTSTPVTPLRRPSRTPWLLAAASLLLATALGAGWARERADRALAVQRAEATAQARVAAVRADANAARDSTIAALNTLVAALTEDGVRTARLTATGEPEAMRLTWNRRRGVVVVTAARLAAPAPGRVYQLWGIARGGVPQPLGVFRPGSDGAVRTVLTVPAGAAMDVAAVTVEPEGGSPQPTGPRVMIGTIGAE
jgi:anti-sigma-K factor RskA